MSLILIKKKMKICHLIKKLMVIKHLNLLKQKNNRKNNSHYYNIFVLQ